MKTIIVDDDSLVAISLKTILEADKKIEVVATGSDGKEAVALYEEYQPEVLLMDIQMKEMSGLEAAEIILKKYPEAKILFLTTFSDDEYIVKALNIGAKGYILKQDFEGIVPALLAVERGQSFRSHKRNERKLPLSFRIRYDRTDSKKSEILFYCHGEGSDV